MKSSTLLLSLAAQAALLLGCSAKEPQRSAQPDPIVIGISLGTSGQLGSFALPLKNTLLVAEGQINGNGGVLGRPVRFAYFDDRSESNDVLVNGVKDLIQREKIVALIGPVGSGQVKAVHQLTLGGQVLLIAPSATSTELSTLEPSRDRFLFRTTPNDDLQASAVMRFAQRGPADFGAAAGTPQTCKKMALVNIDNSYGIGMANIIARDWVPKFGGLSITKLQVTEAPIDNYKAELDKIFAAKPDCLVFVTYDDVGGRLVTQLKQRTEYTSAPEPRMLLIGTDGVFTQGFIDNTKVTIGGVDRYLAEGVYGTNPDTNPQTPEFAQFRNVYNAYFPGEPPSFGANTYDAALLVALAIQRAGTVTDRVKMRDALYDVSKDGTVFGPAQFGEAVQAILANANIDYKGASGNVDLDDLGNTEGGFIVWRAQGDALPKDGIGRYKSEELK